MQPRYYQYERPEWCCLTGCGPVAWAILFAWFDINRGVEHAFRGEGFGQDPPMTLNSYSNRMRVLKAYDELHDYCNVICSPFSQQGGTWPTSMTSAFKTYTWPPAIVHALRRGWSTRATTGRWPDAGALPSRDAILGGRPAVTGLGWMWHYVVAYQSIFKRPQTESRSADPAVAPAVVTRRPVHSRSGCLNRITRSTIECQPRSRGHPDTVPGSSSRT